MTHEELKALIKSRFARDRDIWESLGIAKHRYDKLAMQARTGDQFAIDIIAKWAMEAQPTAYPSEDFEAFRKALMSKYGGAIQALARNERPRKKDEQFEQLEKLLLP